MNIKVYVAGFLLEFFENGLIIDKYLILKEIQMMKKEKFNEENYLTVLNCAIANAVYTGDTQVVFDGEEFHWEEVVCQEFIRGYVIRHSDYDISQIPEESDNGEKPNDFQNWLADQLFYHTNKCWEYFQELKTKN